MASKSTKRSITEIRNEQADEILSDQEIARRTAEKKSLIDGLAQRSMPAPAPAIVNTDDAPKSDVSNLLAKFRQPRVDANTTRSENRRADAEALVGDLLTRAHSAVTTRGILESK